MRPHGPFKVRIVPVLRDNYAYLVTDPATRQTAAVDPADADRVWAAVQAHGLDLRMILTTHHHADHAGGNAGLCALSGRKLAVYGGDTRVQAVTHIIDKPGQMLTLGDHVRISAHPTPGHTASHITFRATSGAPSSQVSVPDPAALPDDDALVAAFAASLPQGLETESTDALFTGDTLFVGGCGRFFESAHDPEIMRASLYDRLCYSAAIPATAHVFCGHEYTLSNLEFATSVEPGRAALSRLADALRAVPEASRVSVPSTVALERQINPFLRLSRLPGFSAGLSVAGCPRSSWADALGRLRRAKDDF